MKAGKFRSWLIDVALHLLKLEQDDDDDRLDGRYRMRMARWLRVIQRKKDTGRGVIRVDREGVAYPATRKVVLKGKQS